MKRMSQKKPFPQKNLKRKINSYLCGFLSVYLPFLIISFVFSSCTKKKEPLVIQAAPIPPGKPVEEVYELGLKRYKQKRYQEAIEQFEAVKNNYPFHPDAVEAELYTAESYYDWGKYLQAAEAYGTFRKMHPYHKKAPYALLRQGESYAKEAPKTYDRDLTYCKEALQVFDNFFRRYPDSQYVSEARSFARDCRWKLAGHEFYVGRFYYRTKKYEASINRLKGVLSKHSGFGFDEQAAWYLGLDYMKLKDYDEAKRIFQMIVDRYPFGKYKPKAQRKLLRIKLLYKKGSKKNG